MKELDLILQGWLERRYAGASAAERALFAQFLELPDPADCRLTCWAGGARATRRWRALRGATGRPIRCSRRS